MGGWRRRLAARECDGQSTACTGRRNPGQLRRRARTLVSVAVPSFRLLLPLCTSRVLGRAKAGGASPSATDSGSHLVGRGAAFGPAFRIGGVGCGGAIYLKGTIYRAPTVPS